MSKGGGAAAIGGPRHWSRATRAAAALVLLATAAGALVRAGFLDHPLRYDESYNYLHYSSRSIGTILRDIVPNNHMFHSLLAHFSMRAFGDGVLSMRLPAFFAGVVLIPATAGLCWMLSQRRVAAVMAAWGAAASSALVEYSANSRGYTWLALWTVLLVASAIKILDKPTGWRWWLVWAVCGAMAAFTVPIAVYPVGATVLVIGARVVRGEAAERRAAMRRFAVAVPLCGVLTALAYLPGLVVGLERMTHHTGVAMSISDRRMGGYFGMLRMVAAVWTRDAGVVGTVLFIAGLGALLVTALRRITWRHLLVLMVLLLLPVCLAAQRMTVLPRLWMFALPVAISAAAWGLAEFAAWLQRHGIRRSALVVGGPTLAAAVLCLTNVHEQEILCSEPHMLVDIERIVDTWSETAPEETAVIMRYTPAFASYCRQRRLPDPPAPEKASRVLVVLEQGQELGELPGLDDSWSGSFEQPRPLRSLSSATLYVCGRRPVERLAHRLDTDARESDQKQ